MPKAPTARRHSQPSQWATEAATWGLSQRQLLTCSGCCSLVSKLQVPKLGVGALNQGVLAEGLSVGGKARPLSCQQEGTLEPGHWQAGLNPSQAQHTMATPVGLHQQPGPHTAVCLTARNY